MSFADRPVDFLLRAECALEAETKSRQSLGKRHVDIFEWLLAEVRYELAVRSLSDVGHDGGDSFGGERMIGSVEAASHLDCSPRSVTRYINAGRLPGARQLGHEWLIPASSVADLVTAITKG